MDAISTFFSAWQISEEDSRANTIKSAVIPEVEYHDPRTPERINDADALCAYVGMFNANAPGWKAEVVKSDTIGKYTRVTVAFGGLGPDGKQLVQHGQYFVELLDNRIANMTGFAGTGEPA